METSEDLKLRPLEKIVISVLIPVNTIGYVMKNRTNPVKTTAFYWRWKQDRYKEIVNTLKTGDNLDGMLAKYMPLLSYRLMIKVGLRRTTLYTSNDYEHWRQEYPTDWDRTFNPKYVPKKSE